MLPAMPFIASGRLFCKAFPTSMSRPEGCENLMASDARRLVGGGLSKLTGQDVLRAQARTASK